MPLVVWNSSRRYTQGPESGMSLKAVSRASQRGEAAFTDLGVAGSALSHSGCTALYAMDCICLWTLIT
jgi:hypothetical protein